GYEQIKAFRRARVAKVTSRETPVPLVSAGNLILHLVPVASFRSRQRFDVANMPNLPTLFPPLGRMGHTFRLNLDGHLSYSRGRTERISPSYTQFFRNGFLESVISNVVMDDKERGKLLLAGYYEKILLQDFQRLLNGLRQVGVQPPLWGFLSITGVNGARIPSESDFGDEYREIDRDALLLPEFVIDDFGTDSNTLLRPVFDLVWNASGFVRSVNFDQN